ncbi:YlaF family protein [Sporosarcina obsidiansis]|uniref:YlaF family protein n=1 Tax=Sporosarcina obsidiansis TaxID=2660748 RepID=UPI00129B93A4|nr:YlaF family protein [Sporosarcina obsidiansis]
MKDIKWIFVLYSLAAVLSMSAIGVGIGMRSIFVVVFAIVALILIMGNGFKTKKRMREAGTL